MKRTRLLRLAPSEKPTLAGQVWDVAEIAPSAEMLFTQSIPLVDKPVDRNSERKEQAVKIRKSHCIALIASSFALVVFGWIRDARDETASMQMAAASVTVSPAEPATYFVTRPVREQREKTVHYTVTKPVYEQRTKTVHYTQMTPVHETRTKRDDATGQTTQYTVCKMVPQPKEKTVNFTVCKMVPEQRTKHISYTVTRMVREERILD
ncbi:hypothetical protein [Rhodopirellula baltica]